MVQAAYYSPGGTYFDFPTGTDTLIGCSTPTATPNRAMCGGGFGAFPDVGSYTGSASPYGTFDQGGSLREWNEQILGGTGGTVRGLRGGDYNSPAAVLGAAVNASDLASFENANFGFRVASLIPEPGTGLLVMSGLLGLAYRQRRHARAA